MRNSANIYNLPEHLHARAMCAVTADTDRHRFVIGSNSIKPLQSSLNEIHILQYSEDANRIDSEHIFKVEKLENQSGGMAPEVTQISSSPYNRNMLVVAARADRDQSAILFYQLASEEDSEDICAQRRTHELSVKNSFTQASIHSIVWEDTEALEGKEPVELIIADQEKVQVWDIETKQISSELTADILGGANQECTTIKRNPHDQKVLAAGIDEKVCLSDIRKQTKGPEIAFTAHADQVLDVAFNASKLHTLATSGCDGAIRVWDIRKPDRSLLSFEDDQSGHWITKIRYNPFHDQLILSGSTSTFVSLYRACSVSTQPSPGQYGFTELNNTNTFNMSVGDLSMTNRSIAMSDNMSMNQSINSQRSTSQNNQNQRASQPDKCVQRYELEDSVTSLEWSGADAWVFAALSYNGTFSINTVPSKEKYRILL